MGFASTQQEQDPSMIAARDDAEEPASFFQTEKAIVEASAPISIRQYSSNVAKEVTILEVAPLVLVRSLFFCPLLDLDRRALSYDLRFLHRQT
jgi:hypothetical protein